MFYFLHILLLFFDYLFLLVIIDLAQQKYFEDDAFIEYLKYLQYWKSSKYIKFISYPQCLSILDLLQKEQFRKECLKPDFTNFIHKNQFTYWMHGSKLIKEIELQKEQ